MLGALFARLTSRPDRGRALFETLVAAAREPGWYVEGAVPDTIDGRFRVLSTVVALAILELERRGPAGIRESAALTERFVEAMDTEHRQLGIGDPTLGKTVRKLVGGLARRVALWRATVEQDDWHSATIDSLYRNTAPPLPQLQYSEGRLHALWTRLGRPGEAVAEGMPA